jgi:hypothetical protein
MSDWHRFLAGAKEIMPSGKVISKSWYVTVSISEWREFLAGAKEIMPMRK